MCPHRCPIMFPFIMMVTIILTSVPTSLCADGEHFANCSRPYRCANMFIGYPFWEQGRPEYCGYPGFELNCQGDAPQITIGTTNYHVLGIDYPSQTLKVARADYWNTYCPQYLVNTTLDFNLFSYASTAQNLTLYYGCTTTTGLNSSYNQFSCNINGTENIGYYATRNTNTTSLVSCSNSVLVPISQTAAQNLENSVATPNLTEALNGGFDMRWAANNAVCDQCANSGGQCGYNPTTTAFICYCSSGSFVNTCGGTQIPTGMSSKNNLPTKIAIGISVSVACIIVVFVIICCLRRECSLDEAMVLWKKGAQNDQNVDAIICSYGSFASKQYSYSEVKKMTHSFLDKLGQGGYGCVYKGKLTDGRLVAVKVLSESKGNGEEFINEVASISRTSHINIVTLLGFCYEGTKRALIYEFMPNGSLDKFIYDRGSSNTNCHLEWKMLYQIAVGIARGLEYLHRGCTTRILHLDIKPQNILLDEDFCPKISDFGLAKLCQKKESIVSMLGARGTIGYIAPEIFCRNFGGVSHKSDVYSYGMMVLEMVGRKKNTEVGEVQTSEKYFPGGLYEQIEVGENLKIYGVMTNEEEETARKMILVSLWCIQTNPSDRPSISKVVEMLEGSLHSLQIPPKPFLSSPTRSPQDSSTTYCTFLSG